MTERIQTPASCEKRPTVAVLGAGIAGLTAAHELAERGFVVTVYEGREDERNGLNTAEPGRYPPVKLGGLAASQYSTVGPHGGSRAELRPFPGRRGLPRSPSRAVAGEHGFRFFPAYYLHIWDMFQRIPVYQFIHRAGGKGHWSSTSRTVYDNVRRVVTQGTTVQGKPSLVFPRELPRNLAEFLGILKQLSGLGFTAADVATFQSRLLRYLVTSPCRRAKELQNVSSYDFFVGHDAGTGFNRFSYSPNFDSLLCEMPRVLAAFDSRWGDARTNISTYLQLYLNMDRRDDKADGVLNGPTTEAWFDHWYHHLTALGVRFVRGTASRLDPPGFDPSQPPHLRPRVQITLTDGTRIAPDYTVVAVDAPAAESITFALRRAGTGGTVARLDGFTTLPPPPDGPMQPEPTRPQHRRDPYAMDELGRVPWDRFQTLCGIQYYFDTEFQLLRGHMYYAGTEWALSSINQHGLWEKQPILDRDGHVAVLSVDIGDFNTPSRHLLDEFGKGKAARDCTPDEIAAEVWRQIIAALTSNVESVGAEIMPWPAWYALDRGLVMAAGPGQGRGRIVRNETPYLVPIVGDWENRPGSDPWNPHDTSSTTTPTEYWWLEDLRRWNVWQARHGGYQVHNNSVVFAGTWNKTFTRMTSMEAACESGRHAVNAILDHYIWVQSGGTDRRDATTLPWEFPFGFLDQGLSSPIRMPTPAGDYCYVFDIENREPADTRLLRILDSRFCEQSLPHPLDAPAAIPFGIPMPPIPPLAGGQQMSTPTNDYNQQLFDYLQTGRQLLEQWMAMTTGSGLSAAPFTMPIAPAAAQFTAPAAPFMPPVMPQSQAAVAPPMQPAAGDYTQQLFGYLQAWRQYLEQVTGSAAQPPSASTTQPATAGGDAQPQPQRPPNVTVPAGNETGSKGNFPGGAATDSGPTLPPRFMNRSPRSYSASQLTGTGYDPDNPVDSGYDPTGLFNSGYDPTTMFGREPNVPQVVRRARDETGSELTGPIRPHADTGQAAPSGLPGPPVKQVVATSFRAMMDRAEPAAATHSGPGSLFRTLDVAAARLTEAVETPSQ